MVLKHECASESPGGFIKTQINWTPTSEFLIQGSGVGPVNLHFQKSAGNASDADPEATL